MRCPHAVSILYYLLYFAGRACILFLEPKNLNFIVLVLQNLKFFLMIQQIHALATVDLKHANVKFYTLFICSNLENVIYCVFCDCIDCESLS